ncbi:MAG: helix-turn-helix domain-containing protein, partial [Acidobacteriota bacterium]|nr:helix-turn-helix domain-containing protein [Acidobacteriota bacterium]
MNLPNAGSQDDPWLTLGEIAQELRVNPATVRLWVSKGQLEATRAGMRKWIVRRSEIDRMLAASRSAPEEVLAPPADAPGGSASSEPEVLPGAGASPWSDPRQESAWQLVDHAARRLREAVTASNLAPPSKGYTERLRAIADGLEHTASTIFNAAENGLKWRGGAGWGWDFLGYEVRPGGNRPVRERVWDRFDEAFTALMAAGEGTDTLA